MIGFLWGNNVEDEGMCAYLWGNIDGSDSFNDINILVQLQIVIGVDRFQCSSKVNIYSIKKKLGVYFNFVIIRFSYH